MDEAYSRAGQEDVKKLLVEAQKILASRDEAFVQKMEGLNTRVCGLVEAQQAREKRLQFAKDNLVMLENVKREKEMDLRSLYSVFASLPPHLQAAVTWPKDKVTVFGDSCGIKQKLGDVNEQIRHPSPNRTSTNKETVGSQPLLLHDSHSVKPKWEEIKNQRMCFPIKNRQMYPSRDLMSTPNRKLPPRSQHQLSLIMKKRLGKMKNWQLCPSTDQESSPSPSPSTDQESSPEYKLPPRSQPQLSHESYMMKRKLGENLFASGAQKKQHAVLPNKALASLQSSQYLKPQSMRSGSVAGGVMQEMRQESKVMSYRFNKDGPKQIRQEAEHGEGVFQGARNQRVCPLTRRTLHEEAKTPFKDCFPSRSPSLRQPKPTQRVSSIRQNVHSGGTSALNSLQRSTKMSPVAKIQRECAPLKVNSSSFYLKSILKKR